MKPVYVLFCALATVALASRADAQILYGATASGGAGELYILNPGNGATVQDIGPLNDSGGANYPITGLAFNPVTGVLYGSTGGAAAVHQLVSINPASGLVTPIGPFNVANATMSDLAFAASGQLYGVNSVNPNLHTVNLATGQATAVGPSGLSGFSQGGGVGINLSGTVFGSPQNLDFGTYNSTTGAYTHIGTLAAPTGSTNSGYGALAFDGSGVLYGVNNGNLLTPHLVTINPATAAVTDLGPSVAGLDAIAFGPAAVPEPGTMALLLGPVAIGLVRAARRRNKP